MVTLELNEFSAEDAKVIRELQALGYSDEAIQAMYDEEQKRRKEKNDG